MDIIGQKLVSDENFFEAEFESYKKFCSQDKAEDLRNKDYANKYALDLFKSNYNEYEIVQKKKILKLNHQAELESIKELLLKAPVLQLCDIQYLDLTYEKNSIRLDIGFESDKLENGYSQHYRIELNTLPEPARDLVH